MKDLICIMCPKGCHLKVDEEHGYTVTGNRCPRGAEYGHNELKIPTLPLSAPKAVISCATTISSFTPSPASQRASATQLSTVRLRSKSACRLPVKTDGQIPKYMMEEAMRLLDKVEVTAPVHVGDVVVDNIFRTGVHFVATKTVEE